MASFFGCSRVCEKKSDSYVNEEEGEALAAAVNDEADRWRKTKRERLMTGNDDENRNEKRKLYILDFRKNKHLRNIRYFEKLFVNSSILLVSDVEASAINFIKKYNNDSLNNHFSSKKTYNILHYNTSGFTFNKKSTKKIISHLFVKESD